jgi:23S rRNA (adenine1618-N6)-methyltransferase
MVKLREHGATNFAVTNLKAGHKTRRWAVAWSFGDLRPANAVARHGELVQAVLPTATEWTVAVGEASIEELDEKVNSILTDLDLKWHWRADLHTGVAFARENVWSRSARRKRKFQQQQKENARIEQPPPSKNLKKQIRSDGAANDDGEDDDDDESNESDSSSSSSSSSEPIALAVKIICSEGQVNIRWLRGTDFTLWESFCGMLKRSLGARESGGGKGNKMEE